ncbi:MAG: 50S ribosomal protein L24 [Candidatus Omnitrophica bacterium CG11_big_fil_rev_8_21_14_0_20_42_13]|uniref:Large ribosomal subunit protein uL24 n=1 Tax=Candidatus Ghiorseimicrobium undicola TaxID=1974746 RepID=A0A2H0LVC0_9BACT|nr:MAG: 50S ribosomal protein L24 [Candidatus Omnitrophica bacterium CG11_big_fil_rev_8_21_14_0_20_42_13]
MLRIRKSDIVYVIAGKDKGKTGKVMKVFSIQSRALVEGINKVKKHMRRTREDQKAGVVELESPIHISNLQIYCKNCSKPARIGIKTPEAPSAAKKTNNKIRICKRCKEAI